MKDALTVVVAVLTALAIVGGAALLAYLVCAVDWFADADFTESEFQSRIDAAFKEE